MCWCHVIAWLTATFLSFYIFNIHVEKCERLFIFWLHFTQFFVILTGCLKDYNMRASAAISLKNQSVLKVYESNVCKKIKRVKSRGALRLILSCYTNKCRSFRCICTHTDRLFVDVVITHTHIHTDTDREKHWMKHYSWLMCYNHIWFWFVVFYEHSVYNIKIYTQNAHSTKPNGRRTKKEFSFDWYRKG